MTQNASNPNTPLYLNRESAAHRLGISIGEFRRRQRLGEFKPVKKGEKNELLFSAADIDEIRQKTLNALPQAAAEYTNDQAAEVFAALDNGKSATQCVIELRIPPRAVNALMEEYAKLTGSLWVPKGIMELVNKMPLDGPMPVKTPDDLHAVLKAIVQNLEVKCLECHKRPRQLCKACVNAALVKTRKQADGTDEL